MKKSISILLSFLILISGLNLTLISHICGGQVSETKWTIAKNHISCGMENDNNSTTSESTFKTKCCSDQVSKYKVDDNYNPSSFSNPEMAKKLLVEIVLPLYAFSLIKNNSHLLTSNGPPNDVPLVSDVDLAGICIFRI